MSNTVIIDIMIPEYEFIKYYKGLVREIRTTSRDGRNISFPADILRQFMTPTGVNGTYKITIDNKNRLTSIKELHSKYK